MSSNECGPACHMMGSLALSRPCLGLGLRLAGLLAANSGSRRRARSLRLALLSLKRLSPLLHLLQGSSTLSTALSRLLRALLLDLIQGGTHDSTLELGGTPGPPLLGLLNLDLLVQSPPALGPVELGGLLTLVQQALGLGGGQNDHRAVTPHEPHAMTRIDAVLAERARVSLDHHGG